MISSAAGASCRRAGAPELKTSLVRFLMLAKRQYRNLVGRLLRRKLTVLDTVNNTIEFRATQLGLLGPAPEFPERMSLHERVGELVADRPITYLEFGVWKGESLRKWLTLSPHAQSIFPGFDTFTGLPEAWTARDPKGAFSTGGRAPALDDPRGSLEVGLFQQTLYSFLDRHPPMPRHRVLPQARLQHPGAA